MRISAENIFYRTIDQMKRDKTSFVYPDEILWVVGPPASGKSTIGKYLHDTFEYNKIVEMREICNGVVAKNNGKFDMSEVIAHFVRMLFTVEPGTKVVIDDFVSISCAHLVPLIQSFATVLQRKNPKLPRLRYRICVFTLEQNRSITRQMQKAPNLTYIQCAELYQKFRKRSEQVINFLHTHFQFDVIDANLELYKVKHIALAECKSMENGIPRTQQQTQKYFQDLRKFKDSAPFVPGKRQGPPGFHGSPRPYQEYGRGRNIHTNPPFHERDHIRQGLPSRTQYRLQELSAESKKEANAAKGEEVSVLAADRPNFREEARPNIVYDNHFSSRRMPTSRSNTNLRNIMVQTLDSILQPIHTRVMSNIQAIVQKTFGALLGQYLQEVTSRNVSTFLQAPDDNVEVRSQYYIQPATAFNAYIFINQEHCIIFDSKWSSWKLPVRAYPKSESIIVYGKLFHVSTNHFVFLACDVVSDLTMNFNVDQRSRMMVKVATYLNSQNLPIPVKVNLFIPPDETIILPTDKVRFDDHILPVSGLIFVSHLATFLFDTKIPGFFWDFFDRLVTPEIMRKHIKLETNVPEAEVPNEPTEPANS